MPTCAVCPTETEKTCSGGCGTIFCSEECKRLVWEDAHEFLCSGADPEACYLPPLNRRERQAILDLLEGRKDDFPAYRTDEDVVEQVEKRKEACGGKWETYLDPLTLPTSPSSEPSRSLELVWARSLLWQERVRWRLSLFDQRCEMWSVICAINRIMVQDIDVTGDHFEFVKEKAPEDPFRTYNTLYRQIVTSTALFLAARDVLPELVPALIDDDNLDVSFRRCKEALEQAPTSYERRHYAKFPIEHDLDELRIAGWYALGPRSKPMAKGLLEAKQEWARRDVAEREEVMGPA